MRRFLIWSLSLLFTLGLATAAFVLLFDWNWLRGPLAQALSTRGGREVVLAGDLTGQWSFRPRLVAHQVTVANPDFAPGPFLTADRVETVVDLWPLLTGAVELHELLLVNPKLSLKKTADGRNNWTFGLQQAADALVPGPGPFEMPRVGRLIVQNGRVVYKDPTVSLQVEAAVNSVQGAAPGALPLTAVGTGSLRGQAFSFDAKGGALVSLREPGKPFPLHVAAKIDATQVALEGTLEDPFAFEGVDAALTLKGPDLALLSDLLQVPLPTTPPYVLTGQMSRAGDLWKVTHTRGTVGRSDLTGDIRVDLQGTRPFIQANLASQKLDYRDVGPFLGLTPEQAGPARPGVARRVLPDAPLRSDLVRRVDAQIDFRGADVVAPGAPLGATRFRLDLDKGVMKFTPVEVEVAGGKALGYITVDARARQVRTDYDLRFQGLQLGHFLDAAGLKNTGRGRIDGRAQFRGFGDTVRKSLGTAEGNIRLTMAGGQVSTLAMELVGLDAMEAIGFLIAGDRKAGIRCFLADVPLKDGVARPRFILLDTSDTNVTVEGAVSLKDEALNLRVLGHPKDPSLLSARGPLLVQGSLAAPRVSIDVLPLGARIGGAVALGVLLTPLASILAFIEPGLEQDSDCAALLKANPRG